MDNLAHSPFRITYGVGFPPLSKIGFCHPLSFGITLRTPLLFPYPQDGNPTFPAPAACKVKSIAQDNKVGASMEYPYDLSPLRLALYLQWVLALPAFFDLRRGPLRVFLLIFTSCQKVR